MCIPRYQSLKSSFRTMPMIVPHIQLNNGQKMPCIGLGTYLVRLSIDHCNLYRLTKPNSSSHAVAARRM